LPYIIGGGIEVNEMGVALGKREMHTRVSKENLKEGDRFEDAGVDWM